MKTSQSLIKDILPEDFCPHYIHLKYKVGLRTEPTEAMENGLFFESELLGSARGGKFELPKNKQGKPYKRELDILENVEYAKAKMDKLKIEIEHVQPHLANEDRAGHFDALGTINVVPAIFDVKWTGMSQQQYAREMKYGTLIEEYRTQARHYQSIDPNKDFYFLIFGKSNWCKVIRFAWNSEAVAHHVETKSDIAQVKFENLEDYETNPEYSKCEGCRLREQCKLRQHTPNIEDYD